MKELEKITREQLTNFLWALISIALAIIALLESLNYHDIQGIIYFLLHLQAGILFLLRYREQQRSRNVMAYLVAIMSTFYVYFFEFDIDEAGIIYPLGPLLTLFGSIFCFIATCSLGRCYGVLPISRGVQVKGMYSFVRHPIYLSYMIMDTGIILSYPMIWNWCLFFIALTLFTIRIHYEEQVMKSFPEYEAYQTKVRFKLVPGLY